MAEVKSEGKSEQQSNADLAKLIADGIADGMARHVPKKVTVGEYIKRHGKKLKLTRDCYQNGYRIDNNRLSDEETRLLNQIRRPGRYMDRKVEVIVRPEPENVVEIRYSDKRIDQRMDLAHYFRTFTELLQRILAEQSEAEKQEEERAARR